MTQDVHIEVDGRDLPQLRALLKKHRLDVRRHKGMLKLLDKKPEAFMNTNGRQLIRDWLYSAQVAVRNIETAILEREKANTRKGRG